MKKAFKILVPILMVLLILASLVWYGFVYDRDLVRDIFLKQARYLSTHGQASLSSWFYDLAYEHSGQSNNVAIELANQFKKSGNYTKAESTLSGAIADSPTMELYMALSELYVEEDKIIDAMAMIDNVIDPVIAQQMYYERPAAPTVNVEPGFYNEYIPVELSCENGTVYYVLNDEFPSFATGIYNGPITLPAGETTINAIVVGSNGLVSPIATFTYTVGGVVEEVFFEDNAIEQAVRQQLGLGDSVIYSNQLWEIKDFVVPEGVQNMADISRLLYLDSLTISNYNLDSVAFLSNLSRLRRLNLSGSRVRAEDLGIIGSLPNLQELTLSNCGLSTLTGLENAHELTYLNLSSNSIRNLSALNSLYHLQELDLSHNAVTDLTQLANLSQLTKLNISYNSISSILTISPCTRLTWLDASYNALPEINAVANFSDLTYLNVDHNALTDVDVIGTCTNLQEVRIANNSISNIGALASLVNLVDFDFSNNAVTAFPAWPAESCALRMINGSYNQISDLSPLSNMHTLNFLHMDYNKITSVAALAKCHTLVQINIFGNEIKDPQTITETDIIMNYDPTYSMPDLG